MKKKVYQKATMKVVKVACEHQLLAASGGESVSASPKVLHGTNTNWRELE
jgi:hypothetical protein